MSEKNTKIKKLSDMNDSEKETMYNTLTIKVNEILIKQTDLRPPATEGGDWIHSGKFGLAKIKIGKTYVSVSKTQLVQLQEIFKHKRMDEFIKYMQLDSL